MCFGKIQVLLLACFFTAITRTETELPDLSSVVYPEVYEQRTGESGKVLVIGEDYSLNLVKASVLSDRVLLRVAKGSRVIERYVDGRYYERYLYQDTSKQASLIVKPLSDGHYHLIGLLNFTHRIEPLTSQERSSSNRAAHRISKVIFKDGTPDADASLVDGYGDPEPPSIRPQERALKSFTIEVYAITDLKHTTHFEGNTEKNVEYLMAFWHSVSLRMQQLSPPGYIALIAFEMCISEADEDYLDVLDGDKLVSNETLIALREHTWLTREARFADIVFLTTGRDLVDLVPGGIKNNTGGVAYLGQACRINKVGIGEDDPALFSGVHIAVHEVGHLLASEHDGQGTSSNCLAKDGYVMNPYSSGKNLFSFSSCSRRAIAKFLRSGFSYCLKDHNKRRHVALLPNNTVKLPGQVMNGEEYCKLYFPRPNVSYVKWDSDLSKCKFRCKLSVKADGKPEYAIRFAFDGTPCNRSQPNMKCKNTKCV